MHFDRFNSSKPRLNYFVYSPDVVSVRNVHIYRLNNLFRFIAFFLWFYFECLTFCKAKIITSHCSKSKYASTTAIQPNHHFNEMAVQCTCISGFSFGLFSFIEQTINNKMKTKDSTAWHKAMAAGKKTIEFYVWNLVVGTSSISIIVT